MTEIERLIGLLEQAKEKATGTIGSLNNGFGAWYAEYLLANGVIVPPCKVGDTVWWADTEFEELLKGEVVSFSLHKEGLWAYCRYQGGLTCRHLVSDYFGKTVFLTREEAEKALAEQIAHRFTSRVSEILESGNDVKCKECEYLMFSDCYGECRKGYKGIVNPDGSCGKGKRKGR